MTVSSGLSLAFMVIGLLAVVFALVVIWRRNPATPGLTQAQDPVQLEKASQEADHIRARAETEAAGILERARDEAEQAAQGRREVEEEIRAVKDEVRELRGDLERRELRLADREQRLDEEVKRIEERAQALSARRQDLDRRAAELDQKDAERKSELERVALAFRVLLVQLGGAAVEVLPAGGQGLGALLDPLELLVQPLLAIGQAQLAALKVTAQLADLILDGADLFFDFPAALGGLFGLVAGSFEDAGGFGLGAGADVLGFLAGLF